MATGGRSDRAHSVVVSVQVRDEDGGDVGQHGVHGVAIVAAELAEGSLAAVQQQRPTRAAATQQTGDVRRDASKKCESVFVKYFVPNMDQRSADITDLHGQS